MIAAWNGMMLESFAEAAAVLEREDFRAVAERNAAFTRDKLREGSTLLHVYKDGRAKYHAFLDDYACIASALLTLYETTGNVRWLRETLALTETMIAEFWDEQEGGFFYTGASSERLIVRHKDFFDNATPSGNSVAADLLLRLSLLTENDDYRRKAVTLFRLVRDAVSRYPSAFGCTLGALDFYLSTPREIVIVGDAGDDATRSLLREVWSRYIPHKVVAQTSGADEGAVEIVPLLRGRVAIEGRPAAYVCENYACLQPVTDARSLAEQLDAPIAKSAGDSA